MKRPNWTIVGIALTTCLFGGCSRNTANRVKILDYGLYDATAILSGMPELGQEPNLISMNVLGNRELTTTIPCRVDTYFGFRLEPSTLPPRYHLRLEYEHPPFTGTDGETREVEEVDVESPDDFDGQLIWCFLEEFPNEMVPGKWTFRAFIDEQLVAEKQFQVIK